MMWAASLGISAGQSSLKTLNLCWWTSSVLLSLLLHLLCRFWGGLDLNYKTFIPRGIILEGRRGSAKSGSGRHLCEISPKSLLFTNWHRISRPRDHQRWPETTLEWFFGCWRAFKRNRKWRCWCWFWRSLAPLVDWSALFGWYRWIRRGFLFPTSYCTTFYMASFGNGVRKGAEKGCNLCAGVVSEQRHLDTDFSFGLL